MTRKELKNKLQNKQGKTCYYCGISEDEFIRIWGIFYKTRGRKLEIDRKDNNKGYIFDNCALACAICNNAKSNKFNEEEFIEIGKNIKRVWQARKKRL